MGRGEKSGAFGGFVGELRGKVYRHGKYGGKGELKNTREGGDLYC